MLAELPLLFGGFDERMDEYQVQAIVHSMEKVGAVFERDIEEPYDYITTKEFIWRTATRPYRIMWRQKTLPITPKSAWSLLPYVVEDAVSDNYEYSRTLRQSEG